MARRRDSWGFPPWRGYEAPETDPTAQRACDYHGCNDKGDRPAPKAPNSPDRWYFCEAHAAEYNRNWNFFDGLSADEAAAFEADESRTGAGYAQSNTYGWTGAADKDGLRPVEREALDALGLDADATPKEIKARFRELAKRHHPDQNKDDPTAAEEFQKVNAAYEALRPRLADTNGAG